MSIRGGAIVGSLALGVGLLLAPSASADVQGPEACPPDVWNKVVSFAPTYESIGNTAGKRNASPTSAILRYDLSTTTTKETKWGAELGGSVSWGIGEIEAKTSFEITNSTAKGVTFANTMNVPGGKYGYTTPKIERRKFVVERWQDTSTCGARKLGNVGTLYGITAYPFFSECVASSACSPKP
ncbi:hypothetical protein [Streptomyces sp. NPDC046182]|uniref:hypothetical protein n=1 Tax=Streptomyces sp. NPDC046182 TaxID=3154601 RepID=UPI0033F5A23A